MEKNRKLTILFIMLGSSCISGGVALHELAAYSTLIGWGTGLACQLTALRFAIKAFYLRKSSVS
ncbi:hypothetical protein LF817_10245 [Halobacillus sp. A1]|uniref:hypothetical protein n=1 Tax=Halobacillus sp. A1 TaxID=2880262 RepID=UPI0020A6A64A|nr:hypothetical protein [Halobacillus sp. A1]MCP3031721.1 hypothetical protein [Halobacillus sp. A1]